MTTLTAEEVGKSTNLTAERVRQLRRKGIIQGEYRAGAWFFPLNVITEINNRPEMRGRKKNGDKKK